MKKYLFILIFTVIFSDLKAQNHVDALRYSFLEPLGSARLSSLSGAFNSLGGEMSVIQSNPASLAIYRSDEFSFTFNSANKNTKTNLNGIKTQNDAQKIYLQNIGYVKTLNLNDNSLNGWNRFSYAFTYNRQQNFNQKINYSGETNSSMINNFLSNAQGTSPEDLNPFSESLAYYSWLIDTINNPSSYNSSINNIIGSNQYVSINRFGYIEEAALSISGAYNDNLFVGFQLGFCGIDYRENIYYSEDSFLGNNNDSYETGELQNFSFNQNLHVLGGGVNYKIGVILKPYYWLRIGLAHHSKTYYQIDENWSSNMSTEFSSGDTYTELSPDGFGNFELNTPSKNLAGISLILFRKGLISFDIENIDYSTSNLNASYYNFSSENSNISTYYKDVTNIKIGFEWKFGNIAIRQGIAFFESPFSNEINDYSIIKNSFGIGYYQNQYFVDFGFVNSKQKETYYVYEGVSEPINLTEKNSSFLVTVGYKF